MENINFFREETQGTPLENDFKVLYTRFCIARRTNYTLDAKTFIQDHLFTEWEKSTISHIFLRTRSSVEILTDRGIFSFDVV